MFLVLVGLMFSRYLQLLKTASMREKPPQALSYFAAQANKFWLTVAAKPSAKLHGA
jgi:hypothetical protein